MTETRLAAVERNQERTLVLLEALTEKVDERIEGAENWRDKTDLILRGDGNGRRGHNIRIDRLEQAAERQRWLVRLLFGGFALSVAKVVFDVL